CLFLFPHTSSLFLSLAKGVEFVVSYTVITLYVCVGAMCIAPNTICWMLVYLLVSLILDLILVGIVKAVVHRRRPSHNRMDIFATFSVDRYSFPPGHATRAAMCAHFLLVHLVLATPLRVLVFLWSGLVGLSRVLMGRHNMTEVLFGFLMGYCQYNLVEML
uniref:Polyisoprenoid diphosphate/phosphate phosphohydrolase PLPP6 n=1 Tax=Oncorhynchus kisutch TaxID=8019 RepID=A0A8C7FS75_ONCKI